MRRAAAAYGEHSECAAILGQTNVEGEGSGRAYHVEGEGAKLFFELHAFSVADMRQRAHTYQTNNTHKEQRK